MTTETFKEYQARKKRANPKIAVETSFGEHSLARVRPKPQTRGVETAFGSRAKKRVSESVDPVAQYQRDTEENDRIHANVAPMNKKLSPHEKEAISEYTDESRDINKMLHRHHQGYDTSTPTYDVERAHIDALDTALKKHKTTEDTHVYTGLKTSPARYFSSDDSMSAPKSVHFPAFTSTSSSIGSAREFAEAGSHPNNERHGITYGSSNNARHLLRIDVPKGTHAMSVKKESFCPEENEILLHRGHDMDLHPHPEQLDSRTWLWHAKITGHAPADIHAEDL